jgi:ribosome maturation factor RimP
MDLLQKIKEITTPLLKDHNLKVVKIDFLGKTKGRSDLEILIEKANGEPATIGDCEEISRELAVLIDVEEMIKDKYNLIVSSAGMDRPLVELKDFENFKGQDAKIELKMANEKGQKRFKGKIVDLIENIIKLNTETGIEEINYNDIAKANLVITDEMIRQILKDKKEKK